MLYDIIKYREQCSLNRGSFRNQWEKDARQLDNIWKEKKIQIVPNLILESE